MSLASTFGLITGVYLVAAASPGPNFFIISHLSLSGHRRAARRVALGVSVGSTVWVCAAVAGLATLLEHFSQLGTALRLGGAAYLVWYGLKLLRSAAVRSPAAPAGAAVGASAEAGIRTGIVTCLTNPKSAIFWTSVFASTMPGDAPWWFHAGICAWIALLSACWYLGVGVVFSRRPLCEAYARTRRPIEFLCGGALLALGLRQALVR